MSTPDAGMRPCLPKKPARDRGPGRGAGATTRCPLFRPEAANGDASAHAHTRNHVSGDQRGGPRPSLPNRQHRSALHHRYWRRAARSSRPLRPSVTASNSRLARRATKSFAAFKPFSAARSRTAIPRRSSIAPSPCSSRKWRKLSSGPPPSRAQVLSAPGRIGSFERLSSLRGIPRGMSSARPGGVTAGSAPSSPETDTDARSARSWSSITSCPMRREDWPPSRTLPFVVGATTNTRRGWSSVFTVLRVDSNRRQRPNGRMSPPLTTGRSGHNLYL